LPCPFFFFFLKWPRPIFFFSVAVYPPGILLGNGDFFRNGGFAAARRKGSALLRRLGRARCGGTRGEKHGAACVGFTGGAPRIRLARTGGGPGVGQDGFIRFEGLSGRVGALGAQARLIPSPAPPRKAGEGNPAGRRGGGGGGGGTSSSGARPRGGSEETGLQKRNSKLNNIGGPRAKLDPARRHVFRNHVSRGRQPGENPGP